MKEIRHLKTIKNKRNLNTKMASPAKRPKCRYDFVAFTWRNDLEFQLSKLCALSFGKQFELSH